MSPTRGGRRATPASPEIYRHTQRGTLILAVLGATVLVCAVTIALASTRAAVIAGGAMASVLAVCAWLFGSLTTRVSADVVAVWFGRGLFRREFRSAEIRGARPVRNHWYYGWGMRLTPHGWLFNVSGLDAVELTLSDGRKFRIGTDQPRQLSEAIHLAMRDAG